jgi:hypothetical protein
MVVLRIAYSDQAFMHSVVNGSPCRRGRVEPARLYTVFP